MRFLHRVSRWVHRPGITCWANSSHETGEGSESSPFYSCIYNYVMPSRLPSVVIERAGWTYGMFCVCGILSSAVCTTHFISPRFYPLFNKYYFQSFSWCSICEVLCGLSVGWTRPLSPPWRPSESKFSFSTTWSSLINVWFILQPQPWPMHAKQFWTSPHNMTSNLVRASAYHTGRSPAEVSSVMFNRHLTC